MFYYYNNFILSFIIYSSFIVLCIVKEIQLSYHNLTYLLESSDITIQIRLIIK